MIRSKLSRVMGDRRLKISELSRNTGISRNALTALYYGVGKGIQYDTLSKLCKYFDCQPGDLLKYAPDTERKTFPTVGRTPKK